MFLINNLKLMLTIAILISQLLQQNNRNYYTFLLLRSTKCTIINSAANMRCSLYGQKLIPKNTLSAANTFCSLYSRFYSNYLINDFMNFAWTVYHILYFLIVRIGSVHYLRKQFLGSFWPSIVNSCQTLKDPPNYLLKK